MLGTHNAWSFLKPRKWYLRPFAFTARCQSKNIQEQYDAGSRYFDLRIRFDKHMNPIICHGSMEYKYSTKELEYDLNWLDYQGDVYIRIILDLRADYDKTESWQEELFKKYCEYLSEKFPKLTLTCGAKLPKGETVIPLETVNIPIVEKYSSVCPPKIIDDWVPIVYAKINNKKNIEEYSEGNILLIDFI